MKYKVIKNLHHILLVFFIIIFLYFNFFASFFSVNADIVTIVQASSALAAVLFSFTYINKERLKDFSKFFLICLFLLFTYLFVLISSNFYFDPFKSLKFFSIFIFCGYIGVFLSREFDIKFLVFGVFIVSFIYMFLYVIYGKSSLSNFARVVLGDGNPIWVARMLGLSFIYSVIHIVLDGNFKYKPVFFVLALVSIYTIFMTGSRGPLLSALLALYFVAYFISFKVFKKISLVLISVFFISCLLYFTGYSDVLSRVLEGGSSGRDFIYSRAWGIFLSNPSGLGLGGFGREFQMTVSNAYPHNIILESLVEAGILFTFCFLYLIYKSIMRAVIFTKSGFYSFYFLFAIIVYSLINSMFSGDFTSPKELYILIFFFLFKEK